MSRSQEKEVVGMSLALVLQLPYKGILVSCRKDREKPSDRTLDTLIMMRRDKS